MTNRTPQKLFSVRFWATFVLLAMLTAPLPVIAADDEDEPSGRTGVYTHYVNLVRDGDTDAFKLIVPHLALCFVGAFVVRWRVVGGLTRPGR